MICNVVTIRITMRYQPHSCYSIAADQYFHKFLYVSLVYKVISVNEHEELATCDFNCLVGGNNPRLLLGVAQYADAGICLRQLDQNRYCSVRRSSVIHNYLNIWIRLTCE
jgi:hypothetical protein